MNILLSLPMACLVAFLPASLAAEDVSPGPVMASTEDAAKVLKIQSLNFDRRPSAALKAHGTHVTADAAATFDASLAAFARSVTLGQWEAAGAFLASQDGLTARLLHDRMLASLAAGPPEAAQTMAMIQQLRLLKSRGDNPQILQQIEQMQAMPATRGETNEFSAGDILGMVKIYPGEIPEDTLRGAGAILSQALEGGLPVELMVAELNRDVQEGSGRRLTRLQAAQLLDHAGQVVHARDFLPDLNAAKSAGDVGALILLTRMHTKRHEQDAAAASLTEAWHSCLAVLDIPTPESQRKTALCLAVELAPRVDAELGTPWLVESFTRHPARGMEILTAIGEASSAGPTAHAEDPERRLRVLKLQVAAVTALLDSAPWNGAWGPTLDLLSGCWLREAALSLDLDTSVASAQSMQTDVFGNMFYASRQSMANQPGMVRPIRITDVLRVAPHEAWLGRLGDSARPRILVMKARLLIKSGSEDESFPLIETLSKELPGEARGLVREFLTAWGQSHNPNSQSVRQFSWVFRGGGWGQQAEGIPLTRSKQQRNLVELQAVVAKLRSLPLGELDESLLVKAFTSCHSSAEVYRLEAIRSVFGPLEGLKPASLAALIQGMRANLGKLWRSEQVQQAGKTQRRQKDIEAEVLRGYKVAGTVVEDALSRHEGDWALLAAKAALAHDENEYARGLSGGDAQTSQRREAALAALKDAAERYVAASAALPAESWSPEVFTLWFSAGLGACDPPNLSHENAPDPRQPPKIREVLHSFRGRALERHLELFSSHLNTTLSSIKPEVKHRYLKAGFEIIGDHEKAREARKVFDYYGDLVSEIKLVTAFDGPDTVDPSRPFGVFVNLRHTPEIERESGGFGRYLQNQNNAMYAYNFGRPTENYREKFEEMVRQSLGEAFEILSVTFQDDKVNSRSDPEEGWRYTPYAYLLLKVRRSEVDMLPSLRLDLDFSDTSGYVVLPVESPPLPLDASAPRPEPRPHTKLSVTQTLDERQAGDGKLILEVRASALGLLPELGQILDVDSPGFEVTGVDAQPLLVSRFDPDSPENAVISERLWLVSMKAAEGVEPPRSFRFAALKDPGATGITQRYEDANLVAVPREIHLAERYGDSSNPGWWMGGGALALLLFGLGVLRKKRGAEKAVASEPLQIPSDLNPFTLIAFLRRIQHEGGLGPEASSELQAVIANVERACFSVSGVTETPDLAALARAWVGRVSPRAL